MMEVLKYKNKIYEMAAEPLEQYFTAFKKRPILEPPHTACWRGYFGVWKIIQDKLYLVKLNIYTEGFVEKDIEHIFPGQKEVFAWWFNGEIRIPQGKLLSYVHMGYESIHKKDLFLMFKDGVLITTELVDNRNRLKNQKE